MNKSSPTIREVAARAGVGVATVSRALNRSGYVKPDTLTRILKAARDLNYVPNRTAQAMVRGTTRTIGVITPDLESSIIMGMVKGINRVAYQHGYMLTIMESEGSSEWERAIAQTMRGMRIDGLLLFATPGTPTVVREMQSAGIPLVVLDRLVEGLGVPQVAADHYAGACVATNLLIDQTGEAPAFIAGPRDVWSAEARLKGYQEALKANGFDYDPSRVIPGEFGFDEGFHATKALLTRYPQIHGIFAANDLSGLGSMKALEEEGIRCPNDVKVVGFDDILPARLSNPPLTTLHQPAKGIGETAMTLLLGLIEGDDCQLGPFLLPAELIRRKSC